MPVNHKSFTCGCHMASLHSSDRTFPAFEKFYSSPLLAHTFVCISI